MAEYAPSTLVDLGKAIARLYPGGVASGVLGDSDHTYGYHRARAVLPRSDYSVQLAADRAGDRWAASAVDVKLPTRAMRTATRRLLDAAKRNDKRLAAVREFYGTLDGINVTGWDLHDDAPSSSNDSHLWHIHLSIYRKYATDRTIAAPILSVLAGEKPEDYDMPTVREIWTTDGIVPAPAAAPDRDENPHIQPANALRMMLDRENKIVEQLAAVTAGLAAVTADLAAIKAKVGA